MQELVRHVGEVHRWARANVASPGPEPVAEAEIGSTMAGTPTDFPALVEWFRDGHAALVEALSTADPDGDCWHFLPAPSGTAFWARRQSHETAIHRVDAERASGEPTGFDASFAVDGLDELLLGFMARPGGRLSADPPRTLGVRASDTGDAWTVRIEQDRRVISREPGPSDCMVTGPASDLYLLMWNRCSIEGFDVAGDNAVAALWRSRATVS